MYNGLGLYMKGIWGSMARVQVVDGQQAERDGWTNNRGHQGWVDLGAKVIHILVSSIFRSVLGGLDHVFHTHWWYIYIHMALYKS